MQKIHKSNYVDVRHLLVEQDLFQFIIYGFRVCQFISLAILSVCTLVNNYFHIQSFKGFGRVSCQLVHINEKQTAYDLWLWFILS